MSIIHEICEKRAIVTKRRRIVLIVVTFIVAAGNVIMLVRSVSVVLSSLIDSTARVETETCD